MQKILIKSFHGLEQTVANDATEFGAQEVKTGRRAVSALADWGTIYRINYESRTALSVLVEIMTGKLTNEQSLYNLVQKVTWYEQFGVDRTFRIDTVCFGDLFTNSLYATQLCKDAVVDQFRDRFGRRPNVSRDPNVRINIFINGNRCIISLDTSGASLFKRGYRFHTGEAPLNEVLAAGMIRLTGWQKDVPLVDPMCGSGTIPIEAALLKSKKPAQQQREEDFAFQHLKSFDEKLWKEVKSTADAAHEMGDLDLIQGMDIDRKVLRFARQNARRAEVEELSFVRGDFFKWMPTGTPGIAIFNPPYDERLPLPDAEAFYMQIGNHIKKHCAGWTIWIISGHLEGVKRIGLRAVEKHTLYNGSIECRFQKFEMFEGTLKDHLTSP